MSPCLGLPAPYWRQTRLGWDPGNFFSEQIETMSFRKSEVSDIGAEPSRARPNAAAARRAFDRAARNSGGQWDLADEIARRMAQRLDYVRLAPNHVVDAGCGQSPARLLGQRYPAAQLTGVESSFEMAAHTRRSKSTFGRLKRLIGVDSGRSHMVCGDICALPIADSSVDMVWSNLALPWASSAGKAFSEFQRVLKGGGLLMFSTYGPDTLRELKAAFGCADKQRHVHEFADMHDLGDMLLESGFAEPVMDMDKIVYTYADIASLIRELRCSGQTNVMEDRRHGLMSPAVWNAMSTAYPARPTDARIEATFEIVYGHAWKIEAKSRSERNDAGTATIQWLPDRSNKS